ncbi:MAG TPA: DUF4097 family beta strand repeat-containing protein [Terriglobales bacterium]|nr:DUF4097 family beta strand repeat-containing protein [Terriglobales bacterium]
MSSPAPGPVPPTRRRSLAGPVVLIVMGVVFLMGTMGVLHWHMLGRLFAHYWPLLIILWGIVKLIEHQQAKREGTRASGIGVGGVFLLCCLIVAGLIATQATRVNWTGLHDEIGWDDEDFGNLFDSSYSYTDHISQALPVGGSLHVVSDRGAVNVVVSDHNEITVDVAKRVQAENQQDADKYNAGTKPQIAISDRVVTVNANTQGAGQHGVTADMTISIPRKVPVVISTHHGDVNVTGRDANLDISNRRGDVTVEDLNANVSLSLQHSSAKVSNVSGDVLVDGRVNDITVSNVKGAARLTGEFMESVHLSQIGKAVMFKSSRTDLEFAKLDGNLDLDSGDLRASSASGPGRLTTRSKDIHLDGLSGDLRLEDSNGVVEVLVRKLGNLQIENRNGDIQLSLPPEAAFRIDARARNGEIQSEFAELKVENAHDQASAAGTVGAGSVSVRLNNEHGTIEIHKATVEAAVPHPPAVPKAPKALPPPREKRVAPTEN